MQSFLTRIIKKPAVSKKFRIYNDLLKKESTLITPIPIHAERAPLVTHSYLSGTAFFASRNPDLFIPGMYLTIGGTPPAEGVGLGFPVRVGPIVVEQQPYGGAGNGSPYPRLVARPVCLLSASPFFALARYIAERR